MILAQRLTVASGSFELAGIDFEVPTGAYCVLMGRTGSGKTTLLETICGLKPPRAGKLFIGERDGAQLKPAERGIGLVPQDGALFRTMTVRAHLEFALRVRKWTGPARAARVRELAELLDLRELLDRKPPGLSGGEQQRVALGRALASRPQILCLDEPLTSLDDMSRQELIDLLGRIHHSQGVTALHITHNRAEADQLATLRLVIRDGSLVTELASRSDAELVETIHRASR